MPEKIYHQIQYLCQEIPKVEWSGVLFYRVEGTIKDPKNMKIILEEILLMDKGSSTYTEYAFDSSVVEHIMDNEHLEDCKIGHVHSHNTMGVFFSGTDMSELDDNAPNHNFYTSLIVNNFMNFCAKVAFISAAKETPFVFYGKDEQGKEYEVESEMYTVPEKLMIYDCEIETPSNFIEVEEGFTVRVKEIIQKAEKAASSKIYSGNVSRPAFSNPNLVHNDWRDWEERTTVNTKKEETKTSILTLEEEIELGEEEFLMFVLNTGNDISMFEDTTALLQFYVDQGVSGNALASRVLDTVVDSYGTYFKEFGEEIKEEGMFELALSELLSEIEYRESKIEDPKQLALLKATGLALENLFETLKSIQ